MIDYISLDDLCFNKNDYSLNIHRKEHDNNSKDKELNKYLEIFVYPEHTKENCIFVKDLHFKEVSKDIRIYYYVVNDLEQPGNGFRFFVLKEVSCSSDDPTKDIEVDILYHGVAYFDGMRHLYMGHTLTKNEGYLYYCCSFINENIFRVLGELEKEFCREPEIW